MPTYSPVAQHIGWQAEDNNLDNDRADKEHLLGEEKDQETPKREPYMRASKAVSKIYKFQLTL
jgi:hypothetical protein